MTMYGFVLFESIEDDLSVKLQLRDPSLIHKFRKEDAIRFNNLGINNLFRCDDENPETLKTLSNKVFYITAYREFLPTGDLVVSAYDNQSMTL